MARITNAAQKEMSIEDIRAFFNYDPETGVVSWAVERRCGNALNRVHCAKGAPLRTHAQNRYVSTHITGFKKIYGHKIAWALHWGFLPPPEMEIDHVNGDGFDNRVKNLRLATRQQNTHNMRIPTHNSTGFKGVCFDKSRGLFVAGIKLNGKRKNLGRFVTAEAAHDAYCRAAARLHGDFARFS